MKNSPQIRSAEPWDQSFVCSKHWGDLLRTNVETQGLFIRFLDVYVCKLCVSDRSQQDVL